MRIDPYLMFNGQCEAAFKFYQECLGGTIQAMLKFSDAPKGEDGEHGEDGAGGCGPLPPGSENLIMHACLSVNDQLLMASDTPPNYPHEGTKGFAVSLNVDSIPEAERIFAALSANGTVQMPLGKTFWAARFGMFTDQFGVPWMINCEAGKEGQ
jgi:PhnB protein